MVLETVLMLFPFVVGVAVSVRRGLEVIGTMVALTMVLFAFTMRQLEQQAIVAFITIGALSATSFLAGVLLGSRLPRLQPVGLGGVSLVCGAMFTAVLSGAMSPPVRLEKVQTAIWVDAGDEATFASLKQFAAIPGEKPRSMQLGMPTPQRCELEGESVGSRRLCHYDEGRIEQVVTRWDPPRRLDLRVLETHLPVRLVGLMTTDYLLTPQNKQTHVMTTTEFTSKLAPAWFWRPIERSTVADEHRYLLSGLHGRVAEVEEGVPVRLTVKTNPATFVSVVPASFSGRPRLELGRTPLDSYPGAFVGDTVVMENAELGIRFEEPIEYGQAYENKLISKIFKEGFEPKEKKQEPLPAFEP